MSAAVNAVAFGVYVHRVYPARHDLTPEVYRALVGLGMGGAMFAVVGFFSMVYPSLNILFTACLYALLLYGTTHLVVTRPGRRRAVLVVLFLLLLGVVADMVLSRLVGGIPHIGLAVSMPVLVLGCIIGSAYLQYRSPSTVSVGLVVLTLSSIVAWLLSRTGVLTAHPEYFVFPIIPGLVAASMMFTVMRSWRSAVSAFVVLLALVNSIALSVPALLAGDTEILIYSVLTLFVSLSISVPFDYFVDQAITTHTMTPAYISATLVSVALLIIFNANFYAVFKEAHYLDPWLMWVELVFGLAAITSFILAPMALAFSSNANRATLDVMLAFDAVAATAIVPPVRYVTIEGVLYNRFLLDDLFVYLGIPIAFGVIAFLYVIHRLLKVGARAVALRFMIFMSASVSIGVVAMFSDTMAIETISVLMVAAGMLLLSSSPRLMFKRYR